MSETSAEELQFQNKYSRQIATMGIAAVRKLVKMKILIVGCNGVGVETAKNVILQGTRAVTLCDPVKERAATGALPPRCSVSTTRFSTSDLTSRRARRPRPNRRRWPLLTPRPSSLWCWVRPGCHGDPGPRRELLPH